MNSASDEDDELYEEYNHEGPRRDPRRNFIEFFDIELETLKRPIRLTKSEWAQLQAYVDAKEYGTTLPSFWLLPSVVQIVIQDWYGIMAMRVVKTVEETAHLLCEHPRRTWIRGNNPSIAKEYCDECDLFLGNVESSRLRKSYWWECLNFAGARDLFKDGDIQITIPRNLRPKSKHYFI